MWLAHMHTLKLLGSAGPATDAKAIGPCFGTLKTAKRLLCGSSGLVFQNRLGFCIGN
jgi:hypothetical protein